MRSLLFGILCLLPTLAVADDPIFSGPQSGEKLVPFTVRGVFDDQAGKELDFVETADGKPTMLIFVHKMTRPSVAVTRTVMDYGAKRKKDGLQTAVVWLAEDATEAEARLKRARHALPKNTPIGISLDGSAGPGAYGLNRNVTLTVLIANENKVTANFAIVQPSVQADVPKILKSLVEVIGGEVPSAEELGVRRATDANPRPNAELTALLRQLIQKDNTTEQVDAAAKKIEAHLEKNESSQKQISQITTRIIDAGKLENYGTARAQEHLKKWAEKYDTNPKKPE